jgi:WD40 repeat protein
VAEPFRYAAFISYSSKDAAFAKRLHRSLESYGIPNTLGKFDLLGGGGKPNRIYPVFRDREELSAGNLGERIEAALKVSGSMIVVCSPDAAASPWVEKEIDYFVDLGRRDRVFAIVADTVPLLDTNGADTMPISIPPALRGNALADPKALEPLVADARKGKDGFRNACLKVVAGLIGVTPGQLIDRDRRRRVRQRLAIGVGVTVLTLVAALAAVEVDAKTWRTRLSTYAEGLTKEGRPLDAEPFAVAGVPAFGALITAAGDRSDQALVRVATPRLIADLGVQEVFQLSPNGRALVAWESSRGGKRAVLYDLTRAAGLSLGDADVRFSPDGSYLITREGEHFKSALFDLNRGTAATDLGDLGAFNDAIFSADGKALVAFSESNADEALEKARRERGEAYGRLVYGTRLDDGKFLVSQSLHHFQGALYDLARGGARTDLGDLGALKAFQLTPDGKTLIKWNTDSNAMLCKIGPSGTCADLGAVEDFALSGDGKVLITYGKNHEGALYDLTRDGVSNYLGELGTLAPNGLMLSSNGSILVVYGADQEGKYFDTRKRAQVDIGKLGALQDFHLSKDGKILVTRGEDNKLTRYDLSRAASVDLGDVGDLSAFELSDDGQTLFTWAERKGALFHFDRRTDLGELGGYTLSANALALVTFGEDGRATLFDLTWSRAPISLGALRGAALAADGKTIATWGTDYRVALYDLGRPTWADAQPPTGVALASAVCAASRDAIRPFPKALRGSSRADIDARALKPDDQRIYETLRGRPWNPCDWRGIATIFPGKGPGNKWFEGARQWLRLLSVRILGTRDYACGEINAQGDLDPRRTDSCQLNDSSQTMP